MQADGKVKNNFKIVGCRDSSEGTNVKLVHKVQKGSGDRETLKVGHHQKEK